MSGKTLGKSLDHVWILLSICELKSCQFCSIISPKECNHEKWIEHTMWYRAVNVKSDYSSQKPDIFSDSHFMRHDHPTIWGDNYCVSFAHGTLGAAASLMFLWACFCFPDCLIHGLWSLTLVGQMVMDLLDKSNLSWVMVHVWHGHGPVLRGTGERPPHNWFFPIFPNHLLQSYSDSWMDNSNMPIKCHLVLENLRRMSDAQVSLTKPTWAIPTWMVPTWMPSRSQPLATTSHPVALWFRVARTAHQNLRDLSARVPHPRIDETHHGYVARSKYE